MISTLLNFFKIKSDREIIEEWLAEAHDLVDLERRQKQIARGQAPWQIQANANLKGWV